MCIYSCGKFDQDVTKRDEKLWLNLIESPFVRLSGGMKHTCQSSSNAGDAWSTYFTDALVFQPLWKRTTSMAGFIEVSALSNEVVWSVVKKMSVVILFQDLARCSGESKAVGSTSTSWSIVGNTLIELNWSAQAFNVQKQRYWESWPGIYWRSMRIDHGAFSRLHVPTNASCVAKSRFPEICNGTVCQHTQAHFPTKQLNGCRRRDQRLGFRQSYDMSSGIQ